MKKKILSIFFALVLVLSFSLVTAVPVAAQAPTVTLVTSGDGVAEWSTDTANSGSYSVKLTAGSTDWVDWAGVQIPVGELFSGISTTHTDHSFYYITDGTTSQRPAMALIFEVGEETWKLVEYFTALDTTVTIWTSADLKAELFLMKGSTNLGTAEYWSITGWISDMGAGFFYQDLSAWQVENVGGTALGSKTVDCVEVSIGALTGIVNVDDVTIDGTTYELEQPAEVWVATNGNDANPGTQTEPFLTIQYAIDILADGTINVAAGTYDESLFIDVDGLTLEGAQANVDPRPAKNDGGDRSGAESIIQKTYTLMTDDLNPILIAANNVTINGFTISPHYEDLVGAPNGLLNNDLVRQDPDSWVGTTISYNILTATGHNIVDNCDELVQLKGVTNALIEFNYGYHSEGADSGGNAFNIADGSTNSVIRYNEAHLCGDFQYDKWGGAIYTYESTNISVIGNKVVGGGGITFGASKATSDATWPPMRNAGGTVEGNIVEDAIFGLEIFADDVTVSGNDATGCGGYALNIIGSNVTVHDNNLCNSGTGILVEDKATVASTGVSINANNIYGNTSGLKNEASEEVDATNNWWGNASGPGVVGSGSGDTVSTNVDYKPWLLSEDEEPIADVYSEYISLPDDWSLISPDRAWSDWEAMGSTLIYSYGPAWGTPEQGSLISPLDALYIKTVGGGMMGVNYPEDDLGMYATNLEAGWNLISIPQTGVDVDAEDILSSIRLGANNEIALATLASQGNYNPSKVTFYKSMLDLDEPFVEELSPFDGYWAYMNVAKEFGVVVVP